MRVSPEMTVGALAASVRKEIEERQAFLAMLEGVMANGVSPSTPFPNGAANGVQAGGRPRRGGKKQSIAVASLEILRQAGRPLHGLRELLPQLEAQGLKVKHKAGLATVLMRTGQVERTAPGTFALKGGAARAS
jgi:hypothetical protein